MAWQNVPLPGSELRGSLLPVRCRQSLGGENQPCGSVGVSVCSVRKGTVKYLNNGIIVYTIAMKVASIRVLWGNEVVALVELQLHRSASFEAE